MASTPEQDRDGSDARFVAELPGILSEFGMGAAQRVCAAIVTASMGLIWLPWWAAVIPACAILVHEFVLFPTITRHLVLPNAASRPAAAVNAYRAVILLGASAYATCWGFLFAVGETVPVFLGACWLWGAALHNQVYFSRRTDLYFASLAPHLLVGLVIPFFTDLPWWGPLLMAGGTLFTVGNFAIGYHHRRDLALHAEADRAARARAEEANLAKSQFLTTMSHELRTPLNAIIGYAEIIEEDHEGSQTSTSADDARRVRRAARHLLSLINEVLDLSKIEAGRLELVNGPVDVAALLREVQETVAPIGSGNGNKVILDVIGRIPTLESDADRLKQCLLNLATNACKFTRDGRVTIRASIEQRDGVPVLEIAVVDTGIGISRENQARLFQPFVQVDGAETRKQDGTGLGLVITRKLAQAMGGDVTLLSTPGVGTTFTLALPVREPVDKRVADITAARTRLVMLVTSAAYERDAPQLRKLLKGLDPRDLAAVLGRVPAIAMERSLRLIGQELSADFLRHLDPPASALALGAFPEDHFLPAVQHASSDTPKPGDHVLVIEDDLAAHDLTRRALERLFPAVSCVASGNEGLSRIASAPPALIILDINLPDISGWTVLERLKASPATRNIPVLVVTIDDDRARALTLGACDHMVKPVDRDRLTAAAMRFALPRMAEHPPAPAPKASDAKQFG